MINDRMVIKHYGETLLLIIQTRQEHKLTAEDLLKSNLPTVLALLCSVYTVLYHR
jgi:hypothetical protein